MCEASKKYMMKIHKQRRLSVICPNLKIFSMRKSSPNRVILRKIPSSINTSSESTIINQSDNMLSYHAKNTTKKKGLPKLNGCHTTCQLVSNISLLDNSYSKVKCDVSIGCSDENDDNVEYNKKRVKSTISIPRRDIAFESNIFSNFLHKIATREAPSVLRKSFNSNSYNPFPLLIKNKYQAKPQNIINLKRLRYCRTKQVKVAARINSKIVFHHPAISS